MVDGAHRKDVQDGSSKCTIRLGQKRNDQRKTRRHAPLDHPGESAANRSFHTPTICFPSVLLHAVPQRLFSLYDGPLRYQAPPLTSFMRCLELLLVHHGFDSFEWISGFCRNNNSNLPNSLQNQHVFDGLPRSRSRFSGIDKTVIESLPFFRFSSLKGSRGGLECVICLSKFEDSELLRLLPKCKHAFHMNCLDQWLEKHSSCPLCRDKLSADDLEAFNYSTSLRFLSEQRQESNLELYVQREQSHHGSSRFSIAGSFRKLDKEQKEDEIPIHPKDDENDEDELHKFNHRIIVNDSASVLMKSRWSNVSSSDIMFLNSELLNDATKTRFSATQSSFNGESQLMNPTRLIGDGEIMNIKEEMERKRELESKFIKIQQNESFPFPPLPNIPKASDSKREAKDSRICPSEKRSMSEIVVLPRSYREESGVSVQENEDRMRRLWLPIVRRTVEWFASRERGTNQPQNMMREPSSHV